MSGIKYEVLAGDDLISALRGGRTGDLLDDAAYAAADEIERLQRVLQKVMARCADLLDEDQFNAIDEMAREAGVVPAIALARLTAEVERNEGTLLGMIHHQRDVLRECLPYLNESMAGKRPGRSADDIRAAVKALTSASVDGPKGEK